MASDRAAVEQALSARLKELLAPAVVERFVGGTHTRRFADNLLASFPAWQVDELYRQLEAGGGSELQPRASGKRTGHAPYSSAALAFNVWGRWLGSEPALRVAGIGDFTDRLRVEGKAKIRGGGTANLDVLLAGKETVVGVESKLAEYASLHAAHWKAPYTGPEIRKLLDPQWRAVMEASLADVWNPVRLGIEQLVKHVLGLRTQHPGKKIHLVYVFWEPANTEEHHWVLQHRAEVQQLTERVAGAEVAFHPCSYWTLLDEWADVSQSPAWLPEHLSAVKDRYLLPV